MQKASKIIVQDYGTNCKDCERYQKLGDICMIEHGKKFQWEYCRDFHPLVVLPDYRELMRSVREDHALQRKKEKEKREKEKRQRIKEKAEKEALRKKKRRAMLRKRRERLKKKAAREQLKAEKLTKTQARDASQSPAARPLPKSARSGSGKKSKHSGSRLENSEDRVVSERDSVAGERPNISDDQR
jgi:hypothetical protein